MHLADLLKPLGLINSSLTRATTILTIRIYPIHIEKYSGDSSPARHFTPSPEAAIYTKSISSRPPRPSWACLSKLTQQIATPRCATLRAHHIAVAVRTRRELQHLCEPSFGA